jgi:hypothetical protein
MEQNGFSGTVREAYANQVAYCRNNDATVTARIVAGIAGLLDDPDPGPFIARIRDWQGAALADAVPLRSAGVAFIGQGSGTCAALFG